MEIPTSLLNEVKATLQEAFEAWEKDPSDSNRVRLAAAGIQLRLLRDWGVCTTPEES